MGRILVLGATGEVGGRVVAGLRSRGARVRGASRDPERASTGPAGAGVDWTRLELEDPGTFPAALEGVDRVFMVARPGDDHPHRVAGPFIEAMRDAGVRRAVNLTAIGAEREPEFGLRRVERILEASGLEWTHLRPNFFMQVFAGPPLLPVIRATGELRMPAGDARISYVDTADIAAVAVAVLTEAGHGGRAYTLTGPESLHHDQVARHLAEAAGTEVVYRPLSDDEARAQLAAGGLDPERVERLIGFYRRVRSGHASPVSPDVEAVLGRSARSFREFAAASRDCWRASA